MSATHTTFQMRVYLKRNQHARMNDIVRKCATLYNAALQERRDAYKQANKSVTLYDQIKQFTDIRQDDDEWGKLDVGVGRGVLRRLDRGFNDFFRRVKAGEAPGYPRFKSGYRWRTIDLAEVRPGMVKVSENGRKAYLKIKGLPVLSCRLKRPLPLSDALKTLRLVKRPNGWYVDLGYEVEREPLPVSGQSVGIDMGVNNRVALSTGEMIDRRQVDRSRENRLRAAVERSTRRDSIGRVSGPQSNRRRKRLAMLSRETRRNEVRNRNLCHEFTTDLVRRFDRIAAEDLKIKNMTKRGRRAAPESSDSEHHAQGVHPGAVDTPLPRLASSWTIWVHPGAVDTPWAGYGLPGPGSVHPGAVDTPNGRGSGSVAGKRGLNREILAQTWGLIFDQLTYKAEWAGREFVKVNPMYTSRTCSNCGERTPQSKYRTYSCGLCGYEGDRDTNAATNVLIRAFGPPGEGRTPASTADEKQSQLATAI